MKASILLLLTVLSTGLAASPALAKTISITISQSAELKDGNLAVKVKVGNTGDEAALSVTPVLRFRDKEARGKGRPTLEPNGSFEEELVVPTGELGQGRWPYRLAVDYTDGNSYPFQALHTQMLMVGNPPPAKVAAPSIKADQIAGSGDLTVKVKNLTDAERQASVGVLVPEGLEAGKVAQQAKLGPWAEEEITVPITNRSALAGSRYPVFVTVEYDDGPTHQAVIAQGIVEIVGTDSFLDRNRRLLWIGAAGLVGIWILIVAVRSFGRR